MKAAFLTENDELLGEGSLIRAVGSGSRKNLSKVMAWNTFGLAMHVVWGTLHVASSKVATRRRRKRPSVI